MTTSVWSSHPSASPDAATGVSSALLIRCRLIAGKACTLKTTISGLHSFMGITLHWAPSQKRLERIFRERLSPLYLSVHTTDHSLRTFMLGNKKAPDILACMKRLAAGGILMHTQIVLCPGINDGEHLQKTLDDLAGLFPAVASIAVVPVGLTAFRKQVISSPVVYPV